MRVKAMSPVGSTGKAPHEFQTQPLSICATNYNTGHAVIRHIESVLSLLDGIPFEYIVVDNRSNDSSLRYLRKIVADDSRFVLVEKRCSRGRGRQIAFEESKYAFAVPVDTDTVYFPIWIEFVRAAIREMKRQHPMPAIQAIFSGVFPRDAVEMAGGWRDLQYFEDFDMWMRLCKIRRMRWSPIVTGLNLKPSGAEGFSDVHYSLLPRAERISRLIRRELDWNAMAEHRRLPVLSLYSENLVDLGIGPLAGPWFGQRGDISLRVRLPSIVREAYQIVRKAKRTR